MGEATRQDSAGVLASAVSGDELAFARIIEAHDSEMYRVCVAIGRDPAIAADGVCCQHDCLHTLRQECVTTGRQHSLRTA